MFNIIFKLIVLLIAIYTAFVDVCNMEIEKKNNNIAWVIQHGVVLLCVTILYVSFI